MKILHISNRYPPYSGGVSDRQCRLIVNELSNRGHFNRVLTCDVTSPAIPDREGVALRRLRLGAQRSAFPFLRLYATERRNLQILREELDQVGPDVVVVWGLSGLTNGIVWELERRKLCTVFAVLDNWPRRRERDDPWFRWWSGPLSFRQKLVRVLLYFGGGHRLFGESYHVRRPTEMNLGQAFFASRSLRDSIRRGGFSVEGSEIVPNCIGRDEFPSQQGRRDDPRRLLWIGSLTAEGDAMTAIQALQELRHNGEMRFSLDLFGRGDASFESKLHDYVRNSQLGGAVTIRHASVEEMSSLFPTYDIFLFTARNPGPFPLVLLRAMAARIPVVTTLEGSCADFVTANKNALVMGTGDPVDLAKKIFEVTNDREATERMTEFAYRDVLDNYSAITVAGKVERILNEATRERSYY